MLMVNESGKKKGMAGGERRGKSLKVNLTP